MTVEIALCDDEIAEIEKTENILNNYEKEHPDYEFVIRDFESSDGLLAEIGKGSYIPDLVFMDIYMPGEQGKNIPLGIEAAKRLRDMGSEAKLIFLTTSREYALEAFDVEAACYLVKPVSEGKLFYKLDRYLEETEQERKKCILLKKESKIIKIPLNDVVYCEAQGKRQCIHMADGTELIQNLTMVKLYDICSVHRGFVRVGGSYIVNLEHIDSLSAQEMLMDTGGKIYLPRGTYRNLREQYFDYYCRKE